MGLLRFGRWLNFNERRLEERVAELEAENETLRADLHAVTRDADRYLELATTFRRQLLDATRDYQKENLE